MLKAQRVVIHFFLHTPIISFVTSLYIHCTEDKNLRIIASGFLVIFHSKRSFCCSCYLQERISVALSRARKIESIDGRITSY